MELILCLYVKVVHFSTSDSFGGSAKSAKRIHQGLVCHGHDSRMIVRDKHDQSNLISSIAPNKYIRKLDHIADRVLSGIGLQNIFSPSNIFLKFSNVVKQADVFQLYNIHGGYLATNTLLYLSQIAPIVWRLSDLWPITGHCAYPGDCLKFNSGCHSCPTLSTYPAIGLDTASLLWKHKRSIYRKLNMHIVAPSKWALNTSAQSPLLQAFDHHYIPNGINQEIFFPINRKDARNFLSIPSDKMAILFVAHVAFNNPRKGTDILCQALKILSEWHDYSLIVVGEHSYQWKELLTIPVYNFEYTNDSKMLSLIYNAADIVCIPSAADNLPNTVLEAMACSKPIVASKSGGIVDAVIDEETGLLFETSSPISLAKRLSTLLSSPQLISAYGHNALGIVCQKFSVTAEINAFSSLYSEII
jgi:glycosyltransferase involved in cell wall biosynthesis